MKVTVLLVGAGRFGANYINVLSQINARPPTGLPRIGRLVLSRTGEQRAQAQADQIASNTTGPFDEVIGVEIKNLTQLEKVLSLYTPALTCITARDPVIGDDIHAPYSLSALNCGAVLCEKPFCRAKGDGSSLRSAEALVAHPHAQRFGLELPMAVVGRALTDDATLGPLLANARTLDFFWQKQDNSRDLISDLALHPWSLLPAGGESKVTHVRSTEEQIEIELRHAAGGPSPLFQPCRMVLTSGGAFRGMRVDHRNFQVFYEQGRLQLREHTETHWQDVIVGRGGKHRPKTVLTVNNPIRQQVEAALAGRPWVDAARTWQSQRFLEDCYR